jgi:predicted esterase
MKKVTILISVVSVFMVLSMQFMVEPAAASSFQIITGRLGGADFRLHIPSNWEGDLVVFCIGYSHEPQDANVLLFYSMAFAWITDMGFALAMSNYGEDGYCVKEGVIRTHQLTEYVIDNYDVTGKVYLFGVSMGGGIALLLGAKYPHLYNGVFEMAGVKDVATQYTLKIELASIVDDDDLIAAILTNGGQVPPCPVMFGTDIPAALMAYRAYSLTSSTDIALELGGTPEKKPKAYERVSPIFNALDIEVPTITLHGGADSIVPYAQSLAYLEAVTQAGYSDLYRLYGVPGGEHIDTSPAMGLQIYLGFTWLVNWVENGTPAPPSST